MPAKTRALMTTAALSLGLAAPATAQHMNADEFYQRAIALKKKGAMAMFSAGEIKALVHEARAAGNLVKATRLSIEAQGRRARYCPPKAAKRMGSDEFIDALGALPSNERKSIDMTEATTRLMVHKFPCH